MLARKGHGKTRLHGLARHDMAWYGMACTVCINQSIEEGPAYIEDIMD
jgi:hypothetical protein